MGTSLVISSNLNIGSTPLRPDRFGAPSVQGLSESVTDSAVRKSKKATLEALDSWQESGTLSTEDFAVLNDFTSESRTRYKELKDQWWKLFKAGEEGKPIRDVEGRMAREGNLLARHDKLTTELREANARVAVAALAGAVGGPIGLGVVAGYAAYANGPTWTGAADRSTGAILETMKGLQSGDSRMVTQGNEAHQVHREELWKAMNVMLDTAIASGKAGKPAELDLQYYEMTNPEIIGKIAEAAKAGNPVRLNLDPGRLSFPSKDGDGDSYFSLDATPDKIRTILQLANVPGADVGVSLFPQKKLLNSPTDLMHRKILRFGDQVLISGMNANVGSGENIDSGYLLRGPAARQLVENFSRDVQDSKGATLDDIWGADHIQKFEDTNLRLGKRGFVSLFDSLSGPSEAGTVLPSPQSLEDLEALAETAGAKLRDLVNVPKADYEKVMTRVAMRKSEVELSAKGKQMMRKLIEKAITATNSKENLKRLDAIELPSDKKVGETKVDIADLPVEREALVLNAISQAEEFVYLPGFVVTKAIAGALVARRDELQEAGKALDVRVVADSGLYPHGGTPNSLGLKHLEDNGIQPRWSKLERSTWHDRKIHAKQLITDKGEITGSTNFSNQGFQENWETSAYVHFEAEDKDGMKEREATTAQFESLWDTSYELNSHDHAGFLNRARESTSEWTIEEDRDRSIRHVLRQLINYEKQTGAKFEELVASTPSVTERVKAMVAEGYSKGDAALMACREHLGAKPYQDLLDSVPAAIDLARIQEDVADWKAGRPIDGGSEEPPLEDPPLEDALKLAVSLKPKSGVRSVTSSQIPAANYSDSKEDFYVGNLRRTEAAYLTNYI